MERPRLLHARPESPSRGPPLSRPPARSPIRPRRSGGYRASAPTRRRPSRPSASGNARPSWTATSSASSRAFSRSGSTRRGREGSPGSGNAPKRSSTPRPPATSTRRSWSSGRRSARRAPLAAARARSGAVAARSGRGVPSGTRDPRREGRRRLSASWAASRSGRAGWSSSRTSISSGGTSFRPCFRSRREYRLPRFSERNGGRPPAATSDPSFRSDGFAIPFSTGGTSSTSSPSKKESVLPRVHRPPTPRRELRLIRPADLTGHAHGGFLLKVLPLLRASPAAR